VENGTGLWSTVLLRTPPAVVPNELRQNLHLPFLCFCFTSGSVDGFLTNLLRHTLQDSMVADHNAYSLRKNYSIRKIALRMLGIEINPPQKNYR
jgi:hypothetical protein